MGNIKFEPHTYVGELEDKSRGPAHLVKCVIRKAVNWYLYPWGARQNDFNQGVTEVVENLQRQSEDLQRRSEDLQRQSEDLQRQSEDLQRRSEDLKRMSCKNEDELRILNVGEQNTQYIYSESKISIDVNYESVLQYVESKNRKLSHQDLEKVTAILKQDIHGQLQKNADKGTIVLICENLNNNRTSEAVRKETFVIYKRLMQYSKYNVQLVSFEKGDICKEDGDIAYVGEDCFIDYLTRFKVAMIIWNCSSIVYAHSARGVFKKYVTLFRVTSQNPLQFGGELQEEHYRRHIFPLCHLNDLGFLNVMTLSEKAKDLLQNAGFKNVSVSAPQIDCTEIVFKKREYHMERKLKVGFASSPMQESEMSDRGIQVLAETVRKSQNVEYVLLWRNRDLAVPAELIENTDVDIRYGVQDMQQFYDEIDCMLIPYQALNNNHACSFSAIEAMLAGIPVIATNSAGVADYIRRCGMGIIVEPVGESIAEACNQLQTNYSEYSQPEQNEVLRVILQDNLLREVEKMASSYRPDNIVTLDEWDIMVAQKGNTLVIGQDEIKKYYSQFEVAEHYNNDRFMVYPENCFDAWERCSIDSLIEHKAKGNKIDILDIAPGDGRILQEDIKYGNCVGMDASAAMLNLVRERFAGSTNLTTIEGDYFVDDVDQKFDVITTFRYIRHFSYRDRQRLYKKILSNLKQDGVLIFDVPNIKYECEQRRINGWENFNIYDVFWSKQGIISELQESGFRIGCMIEVGNGLTDVGDEPMTWTIAAIKN